MNYTKPALNFLQQAQLLISRGLIADESELKTFLSQVNYYRFSGYLYPFRVSASDDFVPGTTFDQVKEIYYFDQDLRSLTFSAIGIIEIAVLRTQMDRFPQNWKYYPIFR
jgi:abortive infection bacteriophage resistance protein